MLDLRASQSSIKDQGRRSTCVAFAATAGHEMLRDEGVDLSAEFLHWAAKQRDGLGQNSEGTTLTAAADALVDLGQPTETVWPMTTAATNMLLLTGHRMVPLRLRWSGDSQSAVN